MTEEKKDEAPSNTKLIKEFFGYKPGEGLREFTDEYKALSAEDKEQLGEGIRNGSLTY